MEHHTTTTRAEAERLLGIAEKLLQSRDFAGCKEFASLAQETEPLLDGSEQILAVADVLLASERRIGQKHDWYSILQINNRTDDFELIKKQYRRYALLLHPDKNKFAFADSGFRLVADAWNVLSDPAKKSAYDNEFSVFTKIDLAAMKRQRDLQHQRQQKNDLSNQKLPVRRSPREKTTTNSNSSTRASDGLGSGSERRSNLSESSGMRGGDRRRGPNTTSFWTVCPYCYNLYEYPRLYQGCCLRCQNCERAFTGMEISHKPPTVPGKEAYYCCWGFFPMGFVNGDLDSGKGGGGGGGGGGAAAADTFPNWMPPMFQGNEETTTATANNNNAGNVGVGGMESGRKEQRSAKAAATVSKPGAKKRGRPRKNVINV
ncbi:hypothetical protein ACH5RR_026983 [Cinchona calisaya]|uniref:J domain-containing protein n=1 Tax=Cinchona calisaya TaxID=153742 RepID=A0ABD2Z465_9GENT